ncbi:MAG: hypothetical protein E7215_00085 [Clostridium sulfidigenes]|uniref:Nuclease SbcCD subunit C n=1 Tax=Clostridium sulfidigenes TaxID=318464 RepID=A0A927W4T6_9CLOT|nr:hypothetical protein [Clostridium sulfidigenes]
MKMKLKFEKLLVYSEEKCYVATFEDGINIIIGKNTCGKSTLLQSLLYAMGINDVKQNLYELSEEKVIFRLDCKILRGGEVVNVIFIRDGSILIIREGNKQLRFNGINGDNSVEHIKVKEYLSKLFHFDLLLESKGELKNAPLETMFLPYYISQAVGWVYLQKSFSNLEYYKNFREDYLDYYLGIVNTRDRLEKSKLEKELQKVRAELKIYKTMIDEKVELTSSKLADEYFFDEAERYLEEYNDKKRELKEVEKEHMVECNRLSLLEQRQSVLKKVGFNHKRQNPSDGECPTCHRGFDFSLERFYEYEQSVNDTNKQKEEYKKLIGEKQGAVNSLMKKTNQLRQEIEKMYSVVKEYQVVDVKFEQWVNMKANIKLSDKVEVQVSRLEKKEKELVDSVKNYKTDEEIKKLRLEKEKVFKNLFRNNLTKLGVKTLNEPRYNELYSITSFPSQGVELHKTVMSYHFAFNNMLKYTEELHRFPFLLDAIFKEDIDTENRELIYNFIKSNRPTDTQTIFTVAFSQGEQDLIDDMKSKLGGNVKINAIGELNNKRALLYYSHEKYKELIEETEDWIVEV